ncbi:Dephospho-CoA kinase [Gemmatirosa kalamazoonensis]|uniref:Dephospho-CoA kinase n=1 Tax=Gemmatirosa kalamazoonensis TaxID=861299 RepID=W0RGM0_9BACT|nr:dephospho-CoA kinase [Gemmatirosa kalamazoonensis]AHG90224.1 Dephospho-CoA kinase [Gemmatirosa kalamazoonensis]
MLLVGLTGNIASGKSTVSRLLAAQGATIIDADLLARDAVRPGTPAFQRIVARWGSEVLSPDGMLDRGALRSRVFHDPAELEALNAIVHPEVARLRDEAVAAAHERGDQVVVCDIPLLFERTLVDEFDVVVLVDAPRAVRLERLVRDRALRETDAMAMIAAQMPAELKRARADVVIDNDGTPAVLAERVVALWGDLQRRAMESTAELAVQREERREVRRVERVDHEAHVP